MGLLAWLGKLLSGGQKVRISEGATPMHRAAVSNKTAHQISDLPFEMVNAVDSEGRTPLDYARENEAGTAAHELTKRGALTGRDVAGLANNPLMAYSKDPQYAHLKQQPTEEQAAHSTQGYPCECFKCGEQFTADAKALAAKKGTRCPSCSEWLPVRSDALDDVEFVAVHEHMEVTGSSFADALSHLQKERADREYPSTKIQNFIKERLEYWLIREIARDKETGGSRSSEEQIANALDHVGAELSNEFELTPKETRDAILKYNG